MTNSHGTVESSSSSRASQIPVDDECPVTCAYPNLICYLDRPVARKKRSRKSEIVYQNSVVKDGHKKPRLQDSFSGGEILNSAPVSICSAKVEVEIIGLQGAPPEQLHSSHATNENSYLPSENPQQVKVVFPIQETDRLPDSCKSKPLSKFSEKVIRSGLSSVHKEILVYFSGKISLLLFWRRRPVNFFSRNVVFNKKILIFLQLHGLQEKENKPNNDILLHESQDTTGSNLCAPDTLDFLQGISFSFFL